MPTLEFRSQYRYDHAESGITVPIELAYGSERIKLHAKVDTGAEFCLFQRGFGEALGINIEDGERRTLGTMNGTFVAYGHRLSMRVLDFDFELTAFFPESADIRRNLLGRQGWLLQIRFGVVDYDQRLYVSRYDD